MNVLQVSVYGTLEYTFSLVKILAIIGFLVLAGWILLFSRDASSMGLHLYTASGGFFPAGARGTWTAIIVVIFSYFGVEMIAVAAGEARDPRIAITRAFRSTAIRLILFYLLTLAVMLAIVPWNQAGTTTSPFVRVMQVSHIPLCRRHSQSGRAHRGALRHEQPALHHQPHALLARARGLCSRRARPAHSRRRAGRRRSSLLRAALPLPQCSTPLYSSAAFSLMIAIASFGELFVWLMIFITHLAFRRRHRFRQAWRFQNDRVLRGRRCSVPR